uniref:Translation initiation factor eIF2B subunit delta n=2 Tax=Scylla olivacea TaxID=85551 RepID=A0A0P4VTZ9_SCYOL
MAPPDTPKRRGRKRSKRRAASSGARHTSLSEEPRPATLPSSPAGGKKGPGALVKKAGNKGQANTVVPQQNCTIDTMPQKENKLDNLCNLLENIILQHGREAPTSGQKPAKVDGATALPPPRAGTQNAVPSTSGGLPASLHSALEAGKDLSKEELERERKARKEAKKARKKGPGKENVEERKETQNSGQGSAPATTVKGSPVKGAPTTPVKGAPTTPVKGAAAPAIPVKGAAAAATPMKGAVAKPVKVAAAKSATAGAAVPSSILVVDLKYGKESSEQAGVEVAKPAGQDSTAGKSKADLRRERREKQEAQRQAKLALKEQQEEQKKQKDKQVVMEKGKASSKAKATGEGTRKARVRRASSRGSSERKVPLLGHLPQYSPNPPPHQVNSDSIHPAVLTVGLKMKYGVVEGATARVISMLAALKLFISDYRTPESCDLSRDMAEKLKPNVDFLHACRPHAIAMDNAIRSVKHKINSIDPLTPEAQAKDELRGAIDEFVGENIILASSTIATHATTLIHDDVLLTFGYSALVCDVVEAVVKEGGKVSVVVADYPHPPSGAAMVQRLDRLGVPTYYRLVTDLSHIMSKVTKVVVEAEAVMMNGAVQAMCGTACLALAAATHHKPFIVLCQTYKFCNIDLTDSLVMNELGDANSMVSCPSQEHQGMLADWRDTQNLNVVRLVYDVTPAGLVTVLVTEQNVLPTSAVPVIIHRKYADILGQD